MKESYKELPPLPYDEWKDTYDTLHLYLQIIGKIKLELCSFINQWWGVAFRITPAGISSGEIPYKYEVFSIDYNVHTNLFQIIKSDGQVSIIPVAKDLSVAKMYKIILQKLSEIGIDVEINPLPVEIPNPVPFTKDTQHSTFELMYVKRWWKILTKMSFIFEEFRSRFRGKCSPVQFFWGTMDLNCTRFSGNKCEPPPGVDIVIRQGDNEENFAYGFWAGDDIYPAPAVYAYMYPFPEGSSDETYNSKIGCFILPYEKIVKSEHPRQLILEFLEDKYQKTGKIAKWDIDFLKEEFYVTHKKNVKKGGKSEKRENVWSSSGNNTLN